MGQLADSGRRACRALSGGSPDGRAAAARSAGPLPQVCGTRRYAAPIWPAPARTGPGRPPCRASSRRARPSASIEREDGGNQDSASTTERIVNGAQSNRDHGGQDRRRDHHDPDETEPERALVAVQRVADRLPAAAVTRPSHHGYAHKRDPPFCRACGLEVMAAPRLHPRGRRPISGTVASRYRQRSGRVDNRRCACRRPLWAKCRVKTRSFYRNIGFTSEKVWSLPVSPGCFT